MKYRPLQLILLAWTFCLLALSFQSIFAAQTSQKPVRAGEAQKPVVEEAASPEDELRRRGDPGSTRLSMSNSADETEHAGSVRPQVFFVSELRLRELKDSSIKDEGLAGSASQTEQEKSADTPARQRIVDPQKFPPRSPLPARILLAPFRKLAPKTDRLLTLVETTNALERVRIILSNPYIRPLFGSLGDGSGFGGGVALSTADRLTENARLFFSTHLTTRQYLETLAGIQTDPTGGKVFNLELTTRYRLRPQEYFFGLGPKSAFSQQTNYDLQERGVGLTASLQPHKRVRVGLGVDYSSVRIFGGQDQEFPTTQQLFGSSRLPGLAEGAALLGAFAFAEFEGRDEPGHPRKGAYLSLVASSNDSVGRGDFGFVSYQADARGYIPLGSERRLLALRLLGLFNDPKGGSQIPFFRLARLGNSQTLRGFDTNRFYGRHAVAANIEYRYELIRGIEAVLFTDLGQVYNRRSEFNKENFRATFGGGLQFVSQKNTLFRFLIGKSGEGVRLLFGFGPTF